MLNWVIGGGLMLVTAVLAVVAARAVQAGQRHRRLFPEGGVVESPTIGRRADSTGLARWLLLAGYRGHMAWALFVVAATAAILSGLAIVGAWRIWGPEAWLHQMLDGAPAGIAGMARPLVVLAPWIVGVTMASLPWLWLRRCRRERVALVEQDLPITLELLSTLAEAGLGLDSALARMLSARPAIRPLSDELRLLQADLLAGRPRIEAFRRLARRLDVSAVSMLVSAIIQTEQVGSGLATILRHQADDLRQRRREKAMEMALAMPVKRMFPLVICFLPGIFLVVLGPTAYEFFQYADTIIRARQL